MSVRTLEIDDTILYYLWVFSATERLLKVTEPIVRHCDRKVIEVQTEADNVDCFKVKPSALKYKVTPRIKKLAEPKERK